MDMVKLFPVTELPDGSRRVVDIGSRKILLIHHQGEIFAIDNSCPHMRFPLSDGGLTKDCGIVCPFHHSAFDLKTGDVKEWSPWPPGLGPALGKVFRERVLPIFETSILDGVLHVSRRPKQVE